MRQVTLGLYLLLEAVDQHHVFARSFPSFNRSDYALFKSKPAALGLGTMACTAGTSSKLSQNEAKQEERTATPWWVRGAHVPQTKEYGSSVQSWGTCLSQFFNDRFWRMTQQANRAYVAAGKRCGPMLVAEGIVDRDV